MKILLIVAMCLIACAVGRNVETEYGVPSAYPSPAPPPPQQTEPYPGIRPQRVHRHIYVVKAPEEEAETVDKKVIRIPSQKQKHVNIIFVKGPSPSSDQKTEVILPERQSPHNLIYVLLKSAESDSNIKIRQGQSKSTSKPKVYFIRYKAKEQDSQINADERPRPRPISPPTTLYGPPAKVLSRKYLPPRN